MRIAMIGHKDFPSRSGGVEVVVYELATRLAKKGYDVSVYNRGREKRHNIYWCEGVQVYRSATLKNQSLNAMIYSVTATAAALFRKYDLIHYHALGPSVMVFAAHLFRKRTVATVHGLDWQRAKWSRFASFYLKLGEKIAAKYADEVIVLSKSVQDYFRNTYGRETVLIENAVVPVEYTPCSLLSERLGLERGGYVLFLARIVPEKGLHYLIEAFLNCSTDKKLVIAGEIPDTEYGGKIRKLAAGTDRIIFTGFAQGDVMAALYSNCALYVLPSEIEGLALTLLEAMSAGARCMTSDIPENTDVLGDFGYTFRSGDVGSLERQLLLALSEPEENGRMDEQIRYIMEKYNYSAVVEKTEAVYRKAVEHEYGSGNERKGR